MQTRLVALVALMSLLVATPAFADHRRSEPIDPLDELAAQSERQDRRMAANLFQMESLAAQLPPCATRDELLATIQRSRTLLARMQRTDEGLVELALESRQRDRRDPRGWYDGGDGRGRGPAVVVYAPPPPEPVSEQEFGSLVRAIERQHFDSDRLSLAREIAANRWFTVLQVRRLVGLMTFSDAKVDLAVFLHGRTVDVDNFYLVYDALTFRSDKDELRRRIQG
jgi:hypothetical protein